MSLKIQRSLLLLVVFFFASSLSAGQLPRPEQQKLMNYLQNKLEQRQQQLKKIETPSAVELYWQLARDAWPQYPLVISRRLTELKREKGKLLAPYDRFSGNDSLELCSEDDPFEVIEQSNLCSLPTIDSLHYAAPDELVFFALEERLEKIVELFAVVQRLATVEIAGLLRRLKQEEAEFNARVIVLRFNLAGKKWRRSYLWHLAKSTLIKQKRFLKKKKLAQVFARIEKEWGVSREVLASLLMIETNLGRRLPKTKLLDVLFSLAVVDYRQLANSINKLLKGDNSQLIEERAEFAREELLFLALLLEDNRYLLDLKKLGGSFAGAFGLPQFLPSSCFLHCLDGDNDQKIDLLNWADTLFSVTNHLLQTEALDSEENLMAKRDRRLLAMDKKFLEDYPKLSRQWEEEYYERLTAHYRRVAPSLFSAVMRYNFHNWYAATVLENARLLSNPNGL